MSPRCVEILKRAKYLAPDSEFVFVGRSVNKPLSNMVFLMMLRAAWLYDQGSPCGAEANAAKYLGAEAGFRACETAVLTHGGMGYAKEFHVERLWRDARLFRFAPVSEEMILNFIAVHDLEMVRSY